jgi:Protein of unknown function (DUF1569)
VKSLSQSETRAEIVARVRTVRPDSVARFGVMTAPEMIKHCVICLEAGLGVRTVSPAERVLGRTLIKYIALYAPMRWPSGVPTRPEMDVRRDGDPPGEFVSDVAMLVQRVEEFGVRNGKAPWPRHPIFGAMNELEWKRWAYLHTDHHLRQFSA